MPTPRAAIGIFRRSVRSILSLRGCLALLAIALVLGGALWWRSHPPFGPVLKLMVLRDIPRSLDERAFAAGVDFRRFSELTAESRLAIAQARNPDDLTKALNTDLDGLHVSHLGVLSPSQARARLAGARGGLGVKGVARSEGLLATDVVLGSPADRAGVRRGDLLRGVDERPCRSEEDLQGPPGSSRRIEWRHGAQRHEATIQYASFRRASTDELRWAEGGVAVIGIHTFIKGLYDRARIEGFFDQAKHAPGVVLDLRSNGGGDADEADHLLGQLLPPGTPTMTIVYRESVDAFRQARPGAPLDLVSLAETSGDRHRTTVGAGRRPYAGPLVVLVDGRNGSGGELVPAVLQHYRRARVVGTQTPGKVRLGDFLPLTGGFLLQAPIGEILDPACHSIENVGVTPDVILKPEQTADDEAILDAALRQLR